MTGAISDGHSAPPNPKNNTISDIFATYFWYGLKDFCVSEVDASAKYLEKRPAPDHSKGPEHIDTISRRRSSFFSPRHPQETPGDHAAREARDL